MSFINKILERDTNNFVIKKIQKKLAKIGKIYFVPTSLNSLPENNYEMTWNINYQEDLIKKFEENNRINSFNTFPEILKILEKSFTDRNNILNFLDFGGENIDYYLHIQKNFQNINYFVFNKKKINDSLIKLKRKYNFKNLNVINKFDQIKNQKYDFVNFGSVIHYVNNYEETLSEIIKVSKKFIMFSGTHFYYSPSKKKNIIVKQVNLLPKKYYCYFFNFDNFLEILKKNDFLVVSKDKNTTDKLNYSNFKHLFDIQYTDLLLSK